jgi:hypothetical protein
MLKEKNGSNNSKINIEERNPVTEIIINFFFKPWFIGFDTVKLKQV